MSDFCCWKVATELIKSLKEPQFLHKTKCILDIEICAKSIFSLETSKFDRNKIGRAWWKEGQLQVIQGQ